MSAWSNLEMGCRGWPALENQESRVWETRLVNSLERSHLHLTLRWERNLLPLVSFRFLDGEKKGTTQRLNTSHRAKEQKR